MVASGFTCSVCKAEQAWNIPAYLANDLESLLCATCGRQYRSLFLIEWLQVKEPVGVDCTNCGQELKALGDRAPATCPSHQVTLCSSCATVSALRSHHLSEHSGAKMIWRLYLVEVSARPADTNQNSGVRVSTNDNAAEELLLNQMRLRNAQLYWSGLHAVSSMPIG